MKGYNDGSHIGITIGLCVVVFVIGTLFGASAMINYYEKEAVKRGFGYYETSIDKEVSFFWRTNLTQPKP